MSKSSYQLKYGVRGPTVDVLSGLYRILRVLGNSQSVGTLTNLHVAFQLNINQYPNEFPLSSSQLGL